MAKKKNNNRSVYDSYGYEVQNGCEQYGRYEPAEDGKGTVFVGYGRYIAIETVSKDIDDGTPMNIYSHVLPSSAKEAADKIGQLVYAREAV